MASSEMCSKLACLSLILPNIVYEKVTSDSMFMKFKQTIMTICIALGKLECTIKNCKERKRTAAAATVTDDDDKRW